MNAPGEFSFLIVAGGSGSRIGGQGKQFRSLGDSNKPLWRWSVDLATVTAAEAAGFGADAGIKEIVLVLPQGVEIEEDELPQISMPFKIAFGGPTRTDSVRNGLAACTCDYVMVHDAARPFASERLLRDLMEQTTPTAGAIPVMPVAEAIKHIGADGKISHVDREELYTTQTPQSFFRKTLLQILEQSAAHSSHSFKDEAEAWLGAGLELRCVTGDRLNFKVTWPEDLELAEAFAVNRAKNETHLNATHSNKTNSNETNFIENEFRTGIGYDVHRLVPERPLILGGLLIPSPLGLLGHSDADVLAHAVADALLGAAGLPDIGNLFPASDERYRGADSMELLREAVGRTEREGWETVWVDAVIEAQTPRLNGFLPAIKENLSNVIHLEAVHSEAYSKANQLDNPRVNVKAKSAEETDDPGMGRSITVQAVATLRRCRR